MGNCYTTNASSTAAELSAGIFKEIGLTSAEIRQLRELYTHIDVSGSECLTQDDLCAVFKLPRTRFNCTLFGIGGKDSNTHLNFCRFVCSVWSFLSLDRSQLGAYAFVLYDQAHIGKLPAENVRAMLQDIHGENYHSNIIKATVELLLYNSEVVPLSVFTEWGRGHPSLFAPLQILQTTLRCQICGEGFWKVQCSRRSTREGQENAAYMWKLESKFAEAMFKQQLASRLEAINRELALSNYSSTGLIRGISGSLSGIVGRIPSISLGRAHVPSPRQQDNALVDILDEDDVMDRPPLKIKRKPVSSTSSSTKQSSVSPVCHTLCPTPNSQYFYSRSDSSNKPIVYAKSGVLKLHRYHPSNKSFRSENSDISLCDEMDIFNGDGVWEDKTENSSIRSATVRSLNCSSDVDDSGYFKPPIQTTSLPSQSLT
mmetsp:Transcript_1386/g.2227  ORF Transcript_1386/g.2227 Transcript_1386/m.2227 type:complete len:428 (-) Transcript_1386:8-1291(-)